MKTVLVIDDSEEDRFFTGRTIKKVRPGIEVHEFSYAEDAIGFLRSPERPNFDMLLVDINMPRMDGFEFADAFLALYPELRGHATIYITSSSLNPADQVRAEDHPGIAGFVEKPLTFERIDEILSATA